MSPGQKAWGGAGQTGAADILTEDNLMDAGVKRLKQ